MVREGSAPNFCPPTEEGITITVRDERGDELVLEFLGLILHEGKSYGFFMPIDEALRQKRPFNLNLYNTINDL